MHNMSIYNVTLRVQESIANKKYHIYITQKKNFLDFQIFFIFSNFLQFFSFFCKFFKSFPTSTAKSYNVVIGSEKKQTKEKQITKRRLRLKKKEKGHYSKTLKGNKNKINPQIYIKENKIKKRRWTEMFIPGKVQKYT